MAGFNAFSQTSTDYNYRFEEKTKSGFGGLTGSTKTTTSKQVRQRQANLSSDNNIALKAGNNVTLISPTLEATNNIDIKADNQVILATSKDSDYEHEEYNKTGSFSYAFGNEGHLDETVRHTEITAGGTINIQAANGLVIEYKQNGTLDEYISRAAELAGTSVGGAKGTYQGAVVDTYEGIKVAVDPETYESMSEGAKKGYDLYQKEPDKFYEILGSLSKETAEAIKQEIVTYKNTVGLLKAQGQDYDAAEKVAQTTTHQGVGFVNPFKKLKFLAVVGVVGKAIDRAVPDVVKYSPINPGPLIDDVAKTFRSASYTQRTLSKDTTLYRVISDNGSPTKSYWTSVNPKGPLQSVIDSALDQNWGNTATRVVVAKVPAGTKIYEGVAAELSGAWLAAETKYTFLKLTQDGFSKYAYDGLGRNTWLQHTGRVFSFCRVH